MTHDAVNWAAFPAAIKKALIRYDSLLSFEGVRSDTIRTEIEQTQDYHKAMLTALTIFVHDPTCFMELAVTMSERPEVYAAMMNEQLNDILDGKGPYAK